MAKRPSPNGPPEAGHNSDGLEEYDRELAAEKELAGLDVKELLALGQEILLRQLLVRVKAGTASHQEQAILRNMLRDSGMVLKLDNEPPPAAREELPELHDPEYPEA